MKKLEANKYIKGIVAPLLFVALLAVQPAQASATSAIELGIFQPGSNADASSITNLGNQLGVTFQAAKWYQDWSEGLDTSVANRYHNANLIPEVTWQPQNNGSGIAYSAITNGQYDTYLTSMANQVKSLGYTLRISFAPEANGTWTPWGISQSGNSTAGFVSMWQHVVQTFRNNGANNVEWVWSPNVRVWDQNYSFASFYPGDNYVTYMGLDGYNWGTSQSWSTWESFRTVFSTSYNELVGVSGKNILIMETASAEQGGNKAAWITSMFSDLRTVFPRIKGITWFNMLKETDWRITSSSASALAFTAGVNGTATSPTPTPTPTASPTKAPVKKKAQSSKSNATILATPTPVPAPAPTPIPAPTSTVVATAQPVVTSATPLPVLNREIVSAIPTSEKNNLVIALLLILEAVLTYTLFSRRIHQEKETKELPTELPLVPLG